MTFNYFNIVESITWVKDISDAPKWKCMAEGETEYNEKLSNNANTKQGF